MVAAEMEEAAGQRAKGAGAFDARRKCIPQAGPRTALSEATLGGSEMAPSERKLSAETRSRSMEWPRPRIAVTVSGQSGP